MEEKLVNTNLLVSQARVQIKWQTPKKEIVTQRRGLKSNIWEGLEAQIHAHFLFLPFFLLKMLIVLNSMQGHLQSQCLVSHKCSYQALCLAKRGKVQ